MRAGEVLAEGHPLRLALAENLNFGRTSGEPERGLDGFGEATPDARLQDQPVDDHVDGVGFVALEFELATIGELNRLPVDNGSRKSLLGEIIEERRVLTLATPHHRGQHQEARPLVHRHDAVDDLLGRLSADGPATGRTVRVTGSSP